MARPDSIKLIKNTFKEQNLSMAELILILGKVYQERSFITMSIGEYAEKLTTWHSQFQQTPRLFISSVR
jgi:hypothetical protein